MLNFRCDDNSEKSQTAPESVVSEAEKKQRAPREWQPEDSMEVEHLSKVGNGYTCLICDKTLVTRQRAVCKY